MSIQFFHVPLVVRVPGSYVEFDGSQAQNGAAIQPHDALLIGQKLATGSAVVGTIYPIASPNEAIQLFGQHSQLAQQCAAYRAVDKLTPLYAVVPAADAGGGTNATGLFTIAGTATETRELALYIGGRRIAVAVNAGDIATAVATKITAAHALLADSPVTATTTDATTPLTCVHKGTIGNQVLLGHSLNSGERVPTGLTVTPTAMSGGATDPDYTGAVTAMGDDQYHTVAVGVRTDTEIDKVVAELEDRWKPPRQIEGVVFAAAQDSRPNLTTYGNGNNSPVLCVVGYEASALCPLPWEIAAQTAALNARRVQSDPAVNGIGDSYVLASAAPRGAGRFKWADRDILLSDGISTTKAGSDGRMLVEWLITSYQTNSLGLPDSAFRDLYKVRLLAALRYSFRVWMSKFANAKLADDGNEVPGQLIITPSVGKSEALAWFLSMRDLGWVENYAQFSAELRVERNADQNRLDFYLPPNLIDNLVTTAAKMSFR